MEWKLLIMTFGSVFLAELGDKTQLATIGFAASGRTPWVVFIGSALALIITSLLGVLVGAGLQKVLPIRAVHIISGVLFVGIGILLIIRNIRV